MSDILHIIQHALSVDEYGRGDQYRRHFVTGEGSLDHPACLEAVAQGLMTRQQGNQLTGDMDLFLVTPSGRQWMSDNSPPPPKLTRGQRRYRNWFDSGAADCGVSFIDFCRRKGAAA